MAREAAASRRPGDIALAVATLFPVTRQITPVAGQFLLIAALLLLGAFHAPHVAFAHLVALAGFVALQIAIVLADLSVVLAHLIGTRRHDRRSRDHASQRTNEGIRDAAHDVSSSQNWMLNHPAGRVTR
jgi:hypothetical protein